MKTTLIIALILFPVLSSAQTFERVVEALIRTENNKPVTGRVTLTDLISQTSFEGTHFKIVHGKSDEAIDFDAEQALTFRAATAYYHLTKARNYFIETIQSDYVRNLPQLTIRIDITNEFFELGHFANDNKDPQFNNALTIPAGQGLAGRNIKPWGMEIWFRPSKRVHLRDLKVNDLANREFMGLMASFRDQIHMQSLQRFLSQTIMAYTVDGSQVDPFAMDNLVRTAGSSLIMEAGYLFIDPITRLFSRKWYWIDSALVPEIIYHEYAHIALSDHLKLSHSTPIIEGMADFFAGQIANSPKLAKNIKKYNTFSGKNAKRKQSYLLEFESNEYANTDFVFGLLWEMKKIVGEDKGAAFMYELRKELTTNSTIRGQLIEGLLQTCEQLCDQPFNDKIRILKALNKRGI